VPREDRGWYRNERGSSERGFVAGVVIGVVLLATVAVVRGGDVLPGRDRSQPMLYPNDDRWTAWLADENTCPRGEDAEAPRPVQVQVLLCLVNFARERESLRPLALSSVLSRSAASKAGDIVRCREFRHEACDKSPRQAALAVGYLGAFGENLYMAEGRQAAPRVALAGWLNSDGHRENLFRAQWRTIGISFLGGADIDETRNGVVWVNHFGA
jgi:hypothetical protein